MMDVEVKDPVVQSAINDIIRIINNIKIMMQHFII